jgi:hypothetical protein
MKIVKILVIAAILAPFCRADDVASTPAAPSAAAKNLSLQLLDITGSEAVISQGFELGIKPALERMKAQGMPDELIDSIHAESQRFFAENFKWDDVKPLLAKLYTDSFTEAELTDLVTFYQSPTGKKAASLMPILTQKGMALGMSRIQSHMPEFQQKVGALIQNYKQKQSQAAAPQMPPPGATPPASGTPPQ